MCELCIYIIYYILYVNVYICKYIYDINAICVYVSLCAHPCVCRRWCVSARARVCPHVCVCGCINACIHMCYVHLSSPRFTPHPSSALPLILPFCTTLFVRHQCRHFIPTLIQKHDSYNPVKMSLAALLPNRSTLRQTHF